MKNKGQGLTLDTIVIAALVVIVLVVLILIFTGNMGPFSRTASGCAERGGSCIPVSSDGKCPSEQVRLTFASCEKVSGAEQMCCMTEPTVPTIAPTTT